MNHVGETVLTSWGGIERLSPLANLDLLCEVLKVQLPDKKSRPKQTLTKLFKFRNTLAHGRTHTITEAAKSLEVDDVDDHFGERLLTEWQQLISNDKFAKRAREDVEAVVRAIHDVRPEPKEYPFSFGFGMRSATLDEG